MSETRFQIACLELFNPNRHGSAEKALVDETYLILNSYDRDEFYNNIDEDTGEVTSVVGEMGLDYYTNNRGVRITISETGDKLKLIPALKGVPVRVTIERVPGGNV